MPELLKPEEVAQELKLKRHTIIIWLQTGKLQGIKVGGRWRVAREDLDEFLAKGKGK